MSFEEQLPQWENEGTQPPQSKRVEGWLPNEKPPASWFNWLFGRIYRVLKELQEKAAEKVDVQQAQQTANEAKQTANEAKDTADAAQSDISAHISATTGVHGATSAATPNTLVQRDGNGRIKAGAPSASDDVARKAEVDAVTTQKVNVISEMNISAPGSDYPIGITAFQVSDGEQKGWPSANGVITTVYLASFRCMQFYMVSANNNTSNGRLYVRSWRQDRGWSDFRRVWDDKEMGAESGLAADLVPRYSSSGNLQDHVPFAAAHNAGITAGTSTAYYATIDAGNGRQKLRAGFADNADTVDGQHASSFWTKSEIPYETGTWTPELRFELNNSGVTYGTRAGRYTRIGNLVYFTFRLALTSKGSADGDAYITGLPFTSMSGTEHAAFAIGMFNYINMPSNAYWVYGIIFNSSNLIRIRPSGDLDGAISLNASNFRDNTSIRAEGFYFIPN